MDTPLEFIRNQKVLVIASHHSDDLWIANIFVSVDEQGLIYFIGSKSSKHSQQILKNPAIAFATSWFDPSNHKNRKGIQGTGTCRPAQTDEELIKGISLHNEAFPEFRERITMEWIQSNDQGSTAWVLKPSHIKYWDDELYGENGSKEFTFNSL